jgi:PREDICTED: similar to RE59650p
MVETTAQDCHQFAHCHHFSEHSFTNSEKYYGSVIRLPDLVIFMSTFTSTLKEHIAVRDSAKMLIPTVGIVDTNSDPTLITYPVPGNDDTPSAIKLYCDVFKKAIILGKQKRDEFLSKYGTIPL